MKYNLQSDTVNIKVDGNRDGYWRRKYWNGRLKWEGYYKNGEKNGIWKVYTRDGLYYNQGELNNGKRIGWWQCFSTKDGTEYTRIKYDDEGNPIGLPTLIW